MKQDSISFKALTPKSIALLWQWSNNPHVKEWWDNPAAFAQFKEKYLNKLQSPAQGCFLIMLDNQPIGYAQWYIANRFAEWVEYSEFVYGIDFFIGDPSFLGKGYGSAIVRKFVEFIFKITDAHTIISDPHILNTKAINCLLQARFTHIKTIEKNNTNYFLMELNK